jgi:hypothetical protein
LACSGSRSCPCSWCAIRAEFSEQGARLGADLSSRGAVVLSWFGFDWAVAAASGPEATAARLGVCVLAAAVAVTLTVVASVYRRPMHHAGAVPIEGWERRSWQLALVQAVSIAAVVALFVTTGFPELVAPGVCLVVAAHFPPLATIFQRPLYNAVAAGLFAAAFAGFAAALLDDSDAARAATGFCAAAVLWATALVLIVRP